MPQSIGAQPQRGKPKPGKHQGAAEGELRSAGVLAYTPLCTSEPLVECIKAAQCMLSVLQDTRKHDRTTLSGSRTIGIILHLDSFA